MNILVTGGTGMVGNCIRECVQQNTKYQNTNSYHYLSSKECDLRDKHATLQFFKKNSFDSIIHLAANVGGLFKNMRQNYTMLQDNIAINSNVLESCIETNVTKGVFILSSCIFPKKPTKFPMTEDMLHNSEPHPSNEGYSYAKRLLEIQCRLSNKDNNTHFLCLTPVNLYGPYDNYDPRNSHVIPGIIHRFHKEKMSTDKLSNKIYVAYGTGRPLRQFLYAPDFAKIILESMFTLVCEDTLTIQHMICCSNTEYNLKQTVISICEVMDINKNKVIFDTSWPDGCMKKTVSNSLLKTVFPNFIFTNFKIGLRETYRRYLQF